MSKGMIFWVLMVLWPILGVVLVPQGSPNVVWGWRGGIIVLWCLLFLLGWQVFGFVIQ